MSSPTTVATHTLTVGRPNDGFSVHHPFGILIAISTVGQVVDFSAAVGFYKSDIVMLPAAVFEIFSQDPPTVGRPLIPLVAVLIGIVVFSRKYRSRFFAFQIDYLDFGPVFEVSDFFTIRRERGLETSISTLGDLLFFDFFGISERFIVFVFDPGDIDIPVTVPFTGIYQRTAVR